MSLVCAAVWALGCQSARAYIPFPRQLLPAAVDWQPLYDFLPPEPIRALEGSVGTSEAPQAFRKLLNVFPPHSGARVGFIFELPVSVTGRRSIGDALEAQRMGGSVPVPPSQAMDVSLIGFQQIRFQFTLEGLIIGLHVELFRTLSSEVIYQQFRGYWEQCSDGRIYWGSGARIRFRIRGGRSIFQREGYKAFSDLAKPGHWQGVKPDDLVYEVFGDPTDRLNYEHALRGPHLGQLEDQVLGRCNSISEHLLAAGVRYVEPIYIETSIETSDRIH